MKKQIITLLIILCAILFSQTNFSFSNNINNLTIDEKTDFIINK